MSNSTTWIGIVLFLTLGQLGVHIHSELLVWIAAVIYTIGLIPLVTSIVDLKPPM